MELERQPAEFDDPATMSTIEDQAIRVVQRQVELFNLRNLDQFMGLFEEDALVMDGWTGEVIARGGTEIRPRYEKRFQTPVDCQFIGRLALGNVVVDREVITGLPGGESVQCLAAYTVNVQKARISQCLLFWGEPPPG